MRFCGRGALTIVPCKDRGVGARELSGSARGKESAS
jgi:hypothetical protein